MRLCLFGWNFARGRIVSGFLVICFFCGGVERVWCEALTWVNWNKRNKRNKCSSPLFRPTTWKRTPPKPQPDYRLLRPMASLCGRHWNHETSLTLPLQMKMKCSITFICLHHGPFFNLIQATSLFLLILLLPLFLVFVSFFFLQISPAFCSSFFPLLPFELESMTLWSFQFVLFRKPLWNSCLFAKYSTPDIWVHIFVDVLNFIYNFSGFLNIIQRYQFCFWYVLSVSDVIHSQFWQAK